MVEPSEMLQGHRLDLLGSGSVEGAPWSVRSVEYSSRRAEDAGPCKRESQQTAQVRNTKQHVKEADTPHHSLSSPSLFHYPQSRMPQSMRRSRHRAHGAFIPREQQLSETSQ